MTKRTPLILVLMLCAAFLGFAEVADNFKAGGIEFGANGMFQYAPLYALFSPSLTSSDFTNAMVEIQAAGNIGFFPIDNLALSVQPSFYYIGVATDVQTVLPAVSLCADYYFNLGNSFVLSLGASAGAGFAISLENSSQKKALAFNLMPNVGAWYFLNDRLAVYAKAAAKLGYILGLTDKYGEPEASVNFLDALTLGADVTIGLKYFIPEGRFGSPKQDTMSEIYSVVLGAK